MFNRTIQVRVVKTKEEAPRTASSSDTSFEGKTAIIAHTFDRTLEKLANAVVAYVVVDTVRKVLIARASR